MRDNRLPKPFDAYTGYDKFILATYAQQDRDIVFSILLDLYLEGYRIWFDEGNDIDYQLSLQASHAVRNSSCQLIFISENSWYDDNFIYALGETIAAKKPIARIFIQDVRIPNEFERYIGNAPTFHRNHMDNSSFLDKMSILLPASLRASEILEPSVDPNTFPIAFPELEEMQMDTQKMQNNDIYTNKQQNDKIQHKNTQNSIQSNNDPKNAIVDPEMADDDSDYKYERQEKLGINSSKRKTAKTDKESTRKINTLWKILIILSPLIISLIGILNGHNLMIIDRKGGPWVSSMIIALCAGIVLLVIINLFNLEGLGKTPYPWAILGLALVVYSQLFGAEFNGTLRFLSINQITIRTGYWAVFLFFITMVGIQKNLNLNGSRHGLNFILLNIILVALTFALTLQPSISLAIVLTLVVAVSMGLTGKFTKMIPGLLLSWALIAAAMQGIYSADSKTIMGMTFLTDPFGSSYQSIQAINSIVAGGLAGAKEMSIHLPDALQGFALANVTRYIGIIAGIAAIPLTMFLVITGLKACREEYTSFQGFLTLSLSLFFGGLSLISILGNVGLMPATGEGMPFLGGSLQLTIIGWIWIGFMLRQFRRTTSKLQTDIPNSDDWTNDVSTLRFNLPLWRLATIIVYITALIRYIFLGLKSLA